MGEVREPTKEQKHIIRAHMLIPDTWQVLEEKENHLIVIYKYGKSRKKLDKSINLWTEKEKKDVSGDNQ